VVTEAEDGFGIEYPVSPGDVVTVTDGLTVKSHVVVDVKATVADVDTDRVSGMAAPNSVVQVYIADANTQRQVMADALGNWTADFSVAGGPEQPTFDIVADTSGGAEQFDADGDSTVYDWQVPSFLVFSSWDGLGGWGWPPEADVQVTADDPDTASGPDIERTVTTNPNGSFDAPGVFPDLEPGWLVTVTYGTIVKSHTVQAIAILDTNTETDVVRGTADPGTEVRVVVTDDGDEVVRFATADASGEWTADFSGMVDISVGTRMSVQAMGDGAGGGTQVDKEVMFPPVPMPPGTQIEGGSTGTQADVTPTVFWEESTTVTTTAPGGGTGTVTLSTVDGFVQTIPLVESPPGKYPGTFPPFLPNHGPASIVITITYPDRPPEERTFVIYIDPSGIVRDTLGDPVAGATVTVYRSVDPGGPFVALSDGSSIMSPGNRANPDLTNADGLFGWDVVEGYYKVRAEKAGCNAPGGGSFVETDVLTIPPPVIDLELVLECAPAPTTIAYTGDVQVISPATTNLQATLADTDAACDVVGRTVGFSIDRNGDGDFSDAGEAIGTALTVAGTNNSAQATLSPSQALQPGVYLVKVAFAGTTGCAASEDANGIVSVVTPDDAANGGGWYQIAGVTGASKNVSFGLTTRWDKKTGSFKGQLLIADRQAWRLKGEITSFARTSSSPPTGTASGTASLYRWDAVAHTYVIADASVSFKVTFTDQGSSKKGSTTKPDSFGVNWVRDFGGGAVSPLVTGATLQPLKGGNITIR
jgi:uncharacterized protein YgfB (UPF0149 family)